MKMIFLRNLFGLALCSLFLVLVSPVKADLLLENIETLTDDEWDHGACTAAGGLCITGGTIFYGVTLP